MEMEQSVDRNCMEYDANVDIPALPPSGKIGSLFDVRYTLKIEACVDVSEWYYRMFQKNLKIRTNVIVGTIPLKNYEDPLELSDESQADEKVTTKLQVDRATDESIIDELTVKTIDDDGTLKPSPEREYCIPVIV